MPIIYAAVSASQVVLAEFAAASAKGNFKELAHQLLRKIDVESGQRRMTYEADGFNFNYLLEHGVIFLCLSEQSMGRSAPFAFLKAVAKQFASQYGKRGRGAPEMSMQRDFAPVLKRFAERFSDPNVALGAGGSDGVESLQNDLEEVTSVMRENISHVLERGQQLESLVVQSESLINSSNDFRAHATSLKRNMWWENARLKIALAVGVVLLLFVLSASACGGVSFPSCRAAS